MKSKEYIISILFSLLLIGAFVYDYLNYKTYNKAQSLYEVYLKGNEIGLIKDKDELYNIIDNEQQEIKKEYNIDNVYPPSDLEIVKVNTYNKNILTADEIYSKIENVENFTIKGYIITIKSQGKEITINVLDRSVFEDSIKKFVTAFVGEDLVDSYINGTQDQIKETGSYVESMYFNEAITIKEGFISVKDKIFTNVDELSQYLMFGNDANITNYTIKAGDTISSIAENNKLNTQEFLIANPSYRNANTLLVIGDTVNVTLLNPILNFIYEVKKIEDVETTYMNTTVYDSTKDPDYSEITQAGVAGITRVTEQYKVTNGESSSEVIITNKETIRDTVNQITTKGKKTYGVSTGTYVDTGLDWGWPTNTPYIITCYFGYYKNGERHNGLDISGTGGTGSPIYAIADGVVTQAAYACTNCDRWTSGTYIVISHGNNYYSSYLHLSKLYVKVGESVKRGQKIGGMGTTGNSTGTHLHLGFSYGEPYVGGDVIFYNPLSLYK